MGIYLPMVFIIIKINNIYLFLVVINVTKFGKKVFDLPQDEEEEEE